MGLRERPVPKYAISKNHKSAIQNQGLKPQSPTSQISAFPTELLALWILVSLTLLLGHP